MNSNSKTELVRIVQDIDEGSDEFDLDDLREYSWEQLMTRFGLEENEARHLDMIIQELTLPDRCVYGMKPEQAVLFLETIQEGIHQGWDGYDEYDQVLIRAFLSDIAQAMTLM